MREFRESKGWKLVGTMNHGSEMFGEKSKPNGIKEVTTMKKLRQAKPTSGEDLLKEKLAAEAAAEKTKEFKKKKPRTKAKK